IPVQVITTGEEREHALQMGARGVLHKPVKTRDTLDDTFAELHRFIVEPTRRLLLVEPDDTLREALVALLGGDDVLIQRAQTGREALNLLEERVFDAIVLGLDLADLPAFELIDQIEHTKAGAGTPIIVYAPHELEAADEARLSHLAQS